MTFGAVEQAIEDIRAGKLILVADDEDRSSGPLADPHGLEHA